MLTKPPTVRWWESNSASLHQTQGASKRRRRGYCFLIGDEMNKKRLFASSIARFIGDEAARDLDVREVYRRLQERWNVYFVLPNLTSYYTDPEVEEHWRGILGEGFLKLEDPDAVCDLIALTIGIAEDAITLDEGLDDLADIGSHGGAAVGRALARLAPARRAIGAGALPADL